MIKRVSEQVIEGRPFVHVFMDGKIETQCQFCDKMYALSKTEWISHFSQHTGEYQFECDMYQTSLGNDPLIAFMYRGCYYTRLSYDRVVKHIMNEHKISRHLVLYLCAQFELLGTPEFDKSSLDVLITSNQVSQVEEREESEITDDLFDSH